jgi:tRNA G46 methylase TrmB
MTYQTNWIPIARKAFNPTHFLINSLAFHLAHLVTRSFRSKLRSAATVQKNYDAERSKLIAELGNLDWVDYVFYPQALHDFIIFDDQIIWDSLRRARERLLARLVETVRSRVKTGQTVIEFGSGDGRNLLYLRTLFPDIHFVGLELSPSSVQLSNFAAEKFKVTGVEFIQADVTQPLPVQLGNRDVGLIYSSFALEQMPRIFEGAILNMFALSPTAMVLFEPIPEVWPLNLRGLVGRLRVKTIDRLQNFPAVVERLTHEHPEFHLVKIERSGLAINPHTEMCEVVIERRDNYAD